MRITEPTDFVKDTEGALAILYVRALERRQTEREAVMGVQRKASPADMIGESILKRAISHLELSLLGLICENQEEAVQAISGGAYTLPFERILS